MAFGLAQRLNGGSLDPVVGHHVELETNMKILKSRKKKDSKLRGKCKDCGCRVECTERETKTLIDRDTQPGMATQHVKCPECGNAYLWVK